MPQKKHFDMLVRLVNNLSREELKVAKAFIPALDLTDKKDNLGAKLVDFVRGREDVSWAQAKRKIGPKVQERSFDRLILRLNDKLLESLELDANTRRESQYDEGMRARYRVARWLNQAMVLTGRGFTDKIEELLDKCIVDAEKYELFDLLGQALFQKCSTLATQMRLKERHHYAGKQALNNRALALYETSVNHYYDYFTAAESSGIKREQLALLIEKLNELQEAFKECSSSRIGYLYYVLGTEYYLSIEEFAQSIATSEVLLQLINDNQHIFGARLRGVAYHDLSINLQQVFDFEGSLLKAREAQRIFDGRQSNIRFSREVEAWALAYLNRFDEALEVLDGLIEDTDPLAEAFLYSKRNYLKSYVLFAMGAYRKSYVYLMETKQIERDREGWNIGIRILTILNKIEMVLLESAEAHLESMRKYIQRLGEVNPMRERDIIIFDILRQLEKESFNFKLVQHNCKPLFDKLESTEKGLRWEPGTHELIPFQEWFAAKVEHRQAHFAVSPALVAWATDAHRTEGVLEMVPAQLPSN